MAVILERRFGPDLPTALRALAAAHPGGRIEAWSFDPAPLRRAAEAALAAEGVAVRVHAAWKPALHALLEDPPAPGERLELAPPSPAGLGPARFLQEPWPAPALFAPALRLAPPAPCGPVGTAPPAWRLRRTGRAGGTAETEILAPLRLRPAPGGGEVVACCGWARVRGPDGETLRDGPWETPLEAALDAAFDALRGLASDAAGRARGPGPNPGLDIVLRLEGAFEAPDLARFAGALPEHRVDLAEILHEELHFAGLEIFARAFGLAPGDRTLRAGRIVPVVVPRPEAGGVRLRVTAVAQRPAAAPRPRPPALRAGPRDRPWTAAELRSGLDALAQDARAERLRAVSLRGRPIEGCVIPGAGTGAGPGVLITGGQHANEPSGPPAVLAIARALAAEGAACAVCAMENPDGHALYARLRRLAPRHMHHAARYTALGADLTHLPETAGERAMRGRLAAAMPGEVLHLSLHGYPAQEWIRPFAGYLPPGFESWSLPRGVHLILRHRPEAAGRARAALEAAAAALAGDAETAALNRRQLDALDLHAPEAAAAQARIGPVGISVAEQPDLAVPAMLITEAPDETAEGARFALLVRAQILAGLAAARAWRGWRGG